MDDDARPTRQQISDAVYTGLGGQAADTIVKSVDQVMKQQQGGLLSLGIILALWGASGGMTMTMTAKINPYKYRFGPYAPEVYRAPFPYAYRMNMTPQEASEYCIQELERMFVGVVAPD